MMKPKMRPNVKESISSLEIGQSVEFRMDSVKESTVRSTCSRLLKSNNMSFLIHYNYPKILVTRI